MQKLLTCHNTNQLLSQENRAIVTMLYKSAQAPPPHYSLGCTSYCKVADSNLTCKDDWMVATLSGSNFNGTIFAGAKYHMIHSPVVRVVCG